MDVTGLFTRALDNNGAAYLPYALVGDFTDEEKSLIDNAFAPYVPERVDAMFNNWRIRKVGDDYFLGKRATWDMVWGTNTAQEMADKITEYYTRSYR